MKPSALPCVSEVLGGGGGGGGGYGYFLEPHNTALVKPIFSSFNPFSSLPSLATDDGE